MNELKRQQELDSYRINYDLKERPFEDVVELASTICDAKIAVVSFFDGNQLRFKSKYGTELDHINKDISFCRHILHKDLPHLMIEDTLKHELTKNQFYYENTTLFRFYCGIPLISPSGYIIGTLSILDEKVKTLSDRQLHTLKLLANRLMDYLNEKKEIRLKNKIFEDEQKRLQNLSSMSPSAIFQLEREADGRIYYSFVNKAYFDLYDDLTKDFLYSDLTKGTKLVHPDDLESLSNSFHQSYENNTDWNCIHRIIKPGNKILWISVQARIEKRDDGTATWYGSLQNITNLKKYEETLEQISFDISHVLRKPISTLLGLTSLINNEPDNLSLVIEYSKHLEAVSNELNDFTRTLNETYQIKKKLFTNNSSLSFKP